MFFYIDYVSSLVPEMLSRFHVLIEVLLLMLTLWFLFKKKETKRRKELTQEEEDELIAQWTPDPLVNDEREFSTTKTLDERIVESKYGKYIVVNGTKCLNLASLSFLGLSDHPETEESTINSIRKYGVGSCGPRGFYGTVDVHLELEERLAKFMGVEEAVVYSYGFSTISSAIPAYAKRGDIIFVDEEANFAIQKGLDASRSEIQFFKHNNVQDLESLLETQKHRDLMNKNKAAKTRKFLIVEGIYLKTGEICPLPELIELRNKYQLRMFIDESISFGTLGRTGRGVTEYFNIPMSEVDLMMASMECALATVGGFCLGSSFVVEHQRLSGLGYCFSASLPPLLASAAISALNILENNPNIVEDLENVCVKFHDALQKSKVVNNHFDITGHKISPVKHLKTSNVILLKEVVEKCEKRQLAITQAAFLHAEKNPVYPSIRLSINRLLNNHDIEESIKIIEDVVTSITS